MAREFDASKTLALLATGDEICVGDILNTNSQEIAHQLNLHAMPVRMHAAVPDTIAEIKRAMQFLLEGHAGLIITGGLGPTSDDLTRYALSEIINKPLVMHEDLWEGIVTRLKKFGYPEPPISNRQQALFPEGTNIIPNPNGTAAGCWIDFAGKPIFMLPGPPNECLPMMPEVVLPVLKTYGFERKNYREYWYLFGVSEGKIAEELDALTAPFACTTGYRIFYPYLEFKIDCLDETNFHKIRDLLNKHLESYIVEDGKHIASKVLQQKLLGLSQPLVICDHATGGALEALLKTPATHTHLHFTHESEAIPRVEIHGLSDYWQGNHETSFTDLSVTWYNQGAEDELLIEIPFRGKRVVHYAVEWISRQICTWLSQP